MLFLMGFPIIARNKNNERIQCYTHELLPATLPQLMTRQFITDKLLEERKVKRGVRLEIHDKQLPGFGARLYQTKRVFFVTSRIHGRLVRHTFEPGWPTLSLADARERARQWMIVARGGGDPRRTALDTPRTIEELTERYIEKYASVRHKAITLAHNRGYARKLNESFRERPIAGIQLADLNHFLDGFSNTPVLRNRLRSFLRQLFNWAVQRGYLDASPADKLERPWKEKSRERVLSADEIARIWNASRETGYPLGSAIMVQFAVGGQRSGDVDRMRWNEIDGDLWTILEPTKSESVHVVPLTGFALELLEELPRFDGPYVFSYSGGQRPMTPHTPKMTALKEMAGVPNWRRHDIRRTVATLLGDELGAQPHVAELLQNRHTIIKGVVQTYNRAVYLKEKRDALEALAGYLRGVLHG